MNVIMLSNHPKTIPHPGPVETFSSTKPVAGARNVGDHWPREMKLTKGETQGG